jgi:hypothetical protein
MKSFIAQMLHIIQDNEEKVTKSGTTFTVWIDGDHTAKLLKRGWQIVIGSSQRCECSFQLSAFHVQLLMK